MALNVSGSKYIRVYEPTTKHNISDKICFAKIASTRRTGTPKIDKETGEVLVNPETGAPVQERVYSRWDARFVGGAADAAKALADGTSIDILSGWIVSEKNIGKNGKEYISTYVSIADFELSDVAESDDKDDDIDE